MREYEKSHPWISFNLDLRALDYRTWMTLGEIQSKCEHVASTPLNPDIAQKMHTLFLAKGALGTTAIEGNTLSEQEVIDIIEGKLNLPPSKEYLIKEIDNIVKVCNHIGNELLQRKSSELHSKLLKDFNKRVLENLEVEDGIKPGEIRNYSVVVANYKGAPAEDCEYLLERLCQWLNNDFKAPNETDIIAFSVIKAVVSHIYLAWIHPFGDGNGRTARLMEFQILLASGVPTPAAHLLSNFYNETRQEYYRQLQKTSKTGGDIIPFINYAVRGYEEALKHQIELIREHVFRVTWENYIHDQFKDKNSPADIRRRHLILDISREFNKKKVVEESKIRTISPRLAGHYAVKTTRTLKRDLQVLEDMKLINIERGLISPNQHIILSFLPRRLD